MNSVKEAADGHPNGRRGRLYAERPRPRLSDQAIQDAAANLFAIDPRVEGVVLFGSYVRDRVRGISDLDLAVLTERNSNPVTLDERLEWQEVISEFLHGYPVDVIILANAPLLLQWNIRREGRLLFERRPDAWREFQRRTTQEWRDRAPARERSWQRSLQQWEEQRHDRQHREHAEALEAG